MMKIHRQPLYFSKNLTLKAMNNKQNSIFTEKESFVLCNRRVTSKFTARNFDDLVPIDKNSRLTALEYRIITGNSRIQYGIYFLVRTNC